MTDQTGFFPLEFFVNATPRSSQASASSKERWRNTIKEIARSRIREQDDLALLDSRPLALTIFYFPDAPMRGDIDNIVKPIMDALIAVAYPDDDVVERVVVQKFEPEAPFTVGVHSDQLARALASSRPIVYVRLDDDLNWRTL